MKKEIYKTYGLYTLEELNDVKSSIIDDYIADNDLYDEDVDEEDGYTYDDLRKDTMESDSFNEFIQNGISYDYEDIECEIEGLSNEYYVVVGTLGLWDGAHDIYPTEVKGLNNAISKCLKDALDFELYEDENGDLHIESHHHDGTNCFTIYKYISDTKYEPINFRKEIYGCTD